MKIAARFLGVALAVWALAGSAVAAGAERTEGGGEEEQGPPELQERYLERLNTELQLKPEQKGKIEGILKERTPAMKGKWGELQRLRKRMESLGKEMQTLMLETQEKVREQLTLEQRARFDELKLRQRRRMERRGPGGRPGMDPQELPPGMRERIERGEMPQRFPPERWEEGEGMPHRRGLPPEIREHIERRRERRLPPPGEWDDRPSDDGMEPGEPGLPGDMGGSGD